MSIIRLQHYGITVAEHTRSSRFYSKIMRIPRLGSVVRKPGRSMIGRHLGVPTVRITWLQRGHDSIELFNFPEIKDDPLPPLRRDFKNVGAARIGFRVVSTRGFEHVFSSKNIEYKKAVDPWGEEYLSFSDPDSIPMAVYGGADKGVYLDRASITVSNLDKSIAFYSVLLGLPQTSAVRLGMARDIFPDSTYDGSVRVARVGIENQGVELVEFQGIDRSQNTTWFPDPGGPFDSKYTSIGIKHVCFQAKGTVKWVKKLQSEGVRVIMGPAREPTGLWVTYLLDPDGTIIELYELPAAMTKLMRGASLFWARFLTRRI